MRYIDADSLKAEFTGNFACEYPAPLVKALIDNQPSEDAVKVVRCKDCKYFLDKQRKNHQGVCMCEVKDTTYAAEFYSYANDFCSYGERKEEK